MRRRYVITSAFLILVTFATRNQESRVLASQNMEGYFVRALYVDSLGVKWFGTSKGLCRHDARGPDYFSYPDYLPGNQVNAIAHDGSGEVPVLWVATNGGVSRLSLDPEGVTGTVMYTESDGLLDNDVSDIAIDSRGGVFFSSAGGITWFHDQTMEHLIYDNLDASMVNSAVRQMEIYNDTLYLAQEGGIGRLISGVDGISGATRWTSEYGMTPYSGNIRSILVSGIYQQYFGTDAGLETHAGYEAKQNWELHSTEDGLVQNDVITIAEDRNGGLWLGTFGGASFLKDGSWTSYTSSDGLLNDTVYGIAFDTDGSIWFATASGACRLHDGVFSDFLTDIPGYVASHLDFNAYFNPVSGCIHISYLCTSEKPVIARLYSLDGRVTGQWTCLPPAPGPLQIVLPASGYTRGSPADGVYLLSLIQGAGSGAVKIFLHH